MSFYRYGEICLCPVGSTALRVQAETVNEPFSPLVFLVRDLSPSARGFYTLHTLSELQESPSGVGLLRKQSAPGSGGSDLLGNLVQKHGAAVLNTAYSRALDLLCRYRLCAAKPNRRFRLTLVGLGDVGATLLIGLKLLGVDIEEIGIYDPNEALCARYEMELNQVLPIDESQTLPRVVLREKERLFDCDAFIFTASRGVPSLDAKVEDVRMVQYARNREMLKEYARMARENNYLGLFAEVSDPVDHLCRAVLLESNADESGAYDFRGLLPEQIQGYGLGVMHARARYYAEKMGVSPDTILSFGPHGKGLVIANSEGKAYDDTIRVCSVKIEKRKVTTNLQLKIRHFHIITHQSLHLVLQSVTARFAEMNADDIGGVAHPHVECSCRNCLGCLCGACVLVHAIPP